VKARLTPIQLGKTSFATAIGFIQYKAQAAHLICPHNGLQLLSFDFIPFHIP